MDLFTQGLLGGVLAQSLADKQEKTRATVVGFAAGLLADADTLIRSSSDPLLNIEYHRHFSHSLLFIPVGAAIATLVLWPFLRRHVSLPRLYVFSLAGYSMSGMLDACTSYGTHLFWPFSDERVALNIISIVDPVFTLVLLTSLLLGLRMKRKLVSFVGLTVCAAYLGLGVVQNNRAQQLAEEMISARGHIAEQHVVKPTLGNLILWRSVYIYEQGIYTDAVRLGVFSEDQVFAGDSVQKFDPQRDLPEVDTTSILYRDIQRFQDFSNSFTAFDPTQENVIGDIRYSMLPTSVKPLWGIRFDAEQTQAHADYLFFRDSSRANRRLFMNMLLGKPQS